MSGKDPTEVYDELYHAANIDINGEHNARDGIHTAASGKAPDSARKYAGIEYGIGYAGIVITSRLPQQWQSYTESIVFKGGRIEISIDRKNNQIRTTIIKLPNNGDILVEINGEEIKLNSDNIEAVRPYKKPEKKPEFNISKFPMVVYQRETDEVSESRVAPTILKAA